MDLDWKLRSLLVTEELLLVYCVHTPNRGIIQPFPTYHTYLKIIDNSPPKKNSKKENKKVKRKQTFIWFP